jgi:hypothetical protein
MKTLRHYHDVGLLEPRPGGQLERLPVLRGRSDRDGADDPPGYASSRCRVEQVKGVLQAAGAFDFFSIRGAHTLADLRGPDQVALARDLYAYAHLPMIVGIVLFAFAIAGDLDEQPAGGKV